MVARDWLPITENVAIKSRSGGAVGNLSDTATSCEQLKAQYLHATLGQKMV